MFQQRAQSNDITFFGEDTAKREDVGSRKKAAPKPFLRRGEGVDKRLNAYKLRKAKVVDGNDEADNEPKTPGHPTNRRSGAGPSTSNRPAGGKAAPASPPAPPTHNWAGIVFSPEPQTLSSAPQQLLNDDEDGNQASWGADASPSGELQGSTWLVGTRPERQADNGPSNGEHPFLGDA